MITFVMNTVLQNGGGATGNCPIWIVYGGPYLRVIFFLAVIVSGILFAYPLYQKRLLRRPTYREYGLIVRNRGLILSGMVATISIILLIVGFASGGADCLTT